MCLRRRPTLAGVKVGDVGAAGDRPRRRTRARPPSVPGSSSRPGVRGVDVEVGAADVRSTRTGVPLIRTRARARRPATARLRPLLHKRLTRSSPAHPSASCSVSMARLGSRVTGGPWSRKHPNDRSSSRRTLRRVSSGSSWYWRARSRRRRRPSWSEVAAESTPGPPRAAAVSAPAPAGVRTAGSPPGRRRRRRAGGRFSSSVAAPRPAPNLRPNSFRSARTTAGGIWR